MPNTQNQPDHASPRRAVIVTALPVEFAAVRAHLAHLHDEEHPQGDVYEHGFFQTETYTWHVGIVEIGAGNPNAAQRTERAIAHFRPQVVLFVGVAGGIKDVAIGDVVVATKVYGYHSGKAETEFRTRPEVGQPTHRMAERARAEARKGDWLTRLHEPPNKVPRVLLGPIAAGEQVVASTESETFRLIRASYGDALAVEMESYGFLNATHAYSNLEALVVRGISDLIEGKAEADRSGSQEMASQHAAAFAFEVLTKLKLPTPLPDDESHASYSSPLKIQLRAYNQPIVPSDNNKWVSVEVINEEMFDLTECHGTLEHVIRKEDTHTQEAVLEIPVQLAWNSSGLRTREGLATVFRDKRALLDIARTEQDKNVLLFTTQQGDRLEQQPGVYNIHVEIGGKIRGTSFPSLIFDGYLDYRGGVDLTIKQIENLLDSGPYLTELREQITDTQRKMLTAVWHHFCEHAERMLIYEVHHQFGGKRTARPPLEQLGGSIIYEYQEQNGTTSYQMSFLGVLLTEEGGHYEQLLVEYLTYVVARFSKDPRYSLVTSQEIVDAFNLTSEQSVVLYHLIEMGQFWSRSMWFEAPNWSAGIPADIEDLPDDLRAYVHERAMARYDRAVPLAAIPRDTYLQNKKYAVGQESPSSKEKALQKASETRQFQKQHSAVDVLLITVTEVEAKAVLDALREASDYAVLRRFIENNTYYDLGFIGGARIFMVQSEIGAGGPGGALLTIQEGIKALSPAAVVMVGTAFGVDPVKQRIGEILISRQILTYELQRVGSSSGGKLAITPRGDRSQAPPRMLALFRAGALDWKGPTVQFGLTLSGEKLIDNQDLRDQLHKLEPEAVGGEMEGAGLYAAAQRSKVDWILVKAICDWADGQKYRNKKQRQQKAARNAAAFTIHVLQQGGFRRSQIVSHEQLDPESNRSHVTASTNLQQPLNDTAHLREPNGFSEAGTMRHCRQQHISAMLSDDNVLIIGGSYNENTFTEVLSSAEIYNPSNKVAVLSNRMAVRRYSAVATILSNKTILITGGVGEHGEALDSVEIFNPTMNTFSSIGPMTTARKGHTATLLKNGKVLIAGGSSNNRSRLDSAEIYDPIKDDFYVVGNMNAARLTEHTPNAIRLQDGRVLIAGGYGTTGQLASMEIYDPDKETFSDADNMVVKRSVHTMTLLPDDTVLIAGGYEDNSGHLDSAEIYNPMSGKSILTQNMQASHFYHTATSLPDGKVLIVGGYSSLAELYDPDVGIFLPFANILTSRNLHTAVLLTTRQVLILGGADNSGHSLASIEISTPFQT